jgi:hypothetical protein
LNTGTATLWLSPTVGKCQPAYEGLPSTTLFLPVLQHITPTDGYAVSTSDQRHKAAWFRTAAELPLAAGHVWHTCTIVVTEPTGQNQRAQNPDQTAAAARNGLVRNNDASGTLYHTVIPYCAGIISVPLSCMNSIQGDAARCNG